MPLLVAAILILAIFYLSKDIGPVSLDTLLGKKPLIQTVLNCKTTRLDRTVLTARKDPGDVIRLIMQFNEKPSIDVRDFLITKGIRIYPESWTDDNLLVADATVSSLCFADTLPGITGITSGEQ